MRINDVSLSGAIGNIVIGSQIFDAQQLLNALHAIGLSIQQTSEGILINGVLIKPDAVLDKNVCPLSSICQQRAHFLSVLKGTAGNNTQQITMPIQQNKNFEMAKTPARGYVDTLNQESMARTPSTLHPQGNGNRQHVSLSSSNIKGSETREDDVEKFLQRILRPKRRTQTESTGSGDLWKPNDSNLCGFCFTPRIGQEKYCRTCGEEFF